MKTVRTVFNTIALLLCVHVNGKLLSFILGGIFPNAQGTKLLCHIPSVCQHFDNSFEESSRINHAFVRTCHNLQRRQHLF